MQITSKITKLQLRNPFKISRRETDPFPETIYVEIDGSIDITGLKFVRENSSLPIIADESVKRASDIPRLSGVVDGINIKLVKCGGLLEALRMIHVARAHGLLVIVGCMIESSLGITAAAHLSPLVDYADLDGNLLIENDPFPGVTLKNGKLMLADRPGIGVVKTKSNTVE